MNPNAIADIQSRLAVEEGIEYKSYWDTATPPNLTGGEGHLMSPAECLQYPEGSAIPVAVVQGWITRDFQNACDGVTSMFRHTFGVNFYTFPDSVQEALVDLYFNMGNRLAGFANTIRLLVAGEYDQAADHLLQNAKWVNTVKQTRANAIANLIRQGGQHAQGVT
jgi:GH24 family phage-related lysozyme (muramidase)